MYQLRNTQAIDVQLVKNRIDKHNNSDVAVLAKLAFESAFKDTMFSSTDDEKFKVVLTGCNAGGRLLRDGISVRNNTVTKKETHGVSTKLAFLIIVFMPPSLMRFSTNWA